MGLGYLSHSPKIQCELLLKDSKQVLTSTLVKRSSQIASADSMLLNNLSYWNGISWKWVKYPVPFTGFTGATGNGVFGYKNCVDKMVSQCSIGYDSCSLDRYFCILHANHRSLISWSGYLVIISSQWIWNKKISQIIFQKLSLHNTYLF